MTDRDDDPPRITDLESARLIREGEQACKRWLADDPEQKARYTAARAKLRDGMRAMLDHYERHRNTEQAEAAEAGVAVDRERSRIAARDYLLAQIANTDHPPLHYGIPENELSEIALWVLSEALETMWDEKSKGYR